MKKLLMLGTAAGLFASGPALAQDMAERLLEEYQAEQFDYIEIDRGLTQIKVEATRDGQTIEVIYDADTGRIIDSEVDRASADDMNRTGFRIRDRNRDFTGRDDDDDYDDDRGYDDDDDDSRDDDDHDDHDDDHDDDDHDDDHGNDDHDDSGDDDDDGDDD
jgi:hypothetical protein